MATRGGRQLRRRPRPKTEKAFEGRAEGSRRTRPIADTRTLTEFQKAPLSALDKLAGYFDGGVDDDLDEQHGDDPDAWDVVAEYEGTDPQHDDGDPTQPRETADYWEGGDSVPGGARPGRPSRADLEILWTGKTDFHVRLPTILGAPSGSLEGRKGLIELGRAIVKRQTRYLVSMDLDDLVPLTQADLARDTGIDKTWVARLVDEKRIALPDGTVVPLGDLITDPDATRARFIAQLLRKHDRVRRGPDGKVEVSSELSVKEIREALQNEDRFRRLGNSERTVYAIMKKAGIPTKRKPAYEKGADWWNYS